MMCSLIRIASWDIQELLDETRQMFIRERSVSDVPGTKRPVSC